MRVTRVSSTFSRVFNNAGIPAHMAPAIIPTNITMGSSNQDGKKGDQNRATQAAATPPKTSCPSAPMFQNRSLNAIVTPNPVNIRGMAFTRVSVKLLQLPKAPTNIAAKVRKGFALNIKSKNPVKIRDTKKESIGTSTIARRDTDFRFSNTSCMITPAILFFRLFFVYSGHHQPQHSHICLGGIKLSHYLSFKHHHNFIGNR